MADVNTKLLEGTTDAAAWADEFAKVVPDVDWGLMVAWFANAISTGERSGREDGFAEGYSAGASEHGSGT